MRALLPAEEGPPSPGAALRSYDGAPRASAGKGEAWTVSQVADLWDRHGTSVYALACALLGEDKAAVQVVTLAMRDLVGSTACESTDEARRVLTRHVYRRSLEQVGTAGMTGYLPPAMVWLSRLADLQRTCLALCVFGGQTHREAADLIGIPALSVAHLLTSGLRELSRP